MIRKGFWTLLPVLLSWLVIAAGTAAAAEKVYINGIDAGFPPFAYVDRSGNPDGFDVKALTWIAREMGFKVAHRAMDWETIIPALKAGTIDIIASGMSITEGRKKEVAFSIPYWRTGQILVARKNSGMTADKALSGGNRIGVQRGTPEARWMEENLIRKQGRDFTLLFYDSSLKAMEAVLRGEIAAAAMNDAPARAAVAEKPLVIVGPFGMPDEMFAYAVRKEDAHLLEKINKGLERLMESDYRVKLRKAYIEKR